MLLPTTKREVNPVKRFILILPAILLLLLSPVVSAGAEKATAPDGALVQVVVLLPPTSEGTSYGTGFVVRSDGVIATVAHVYLKAMNAVVDAKAGLLVVRRFSRSNTANWAATPVELLATDYQHDLALLKMKAVDDLWRDLGGIEPPPLDSTDSAEEGDSVWMRGYFGSDRFPTLLRGVVSGSVEMGFLKVQELLITLPVAPGHSGSPLMSDSGRVIGVISAIVPVGLPTQPSHSGLARAVKVGHLKKLLDSLPK